MRRLSLGLFLLVLGATFIATIKTAATVSATEGTAVWEKELKGADLDFCRQLAARGLDGWLENFAADASAISNGKVISGKEALRKYYAGVFASKDFTLTWKPAKAEVSKDGTLGYTYGDYEAREGTNVSRGMYVTEWRRINGKWKVVLDLGSARPEATKSPAGQN